MHRSGTSTFAGVLHLNKILMGNYKNFWPRPLAQNPKALKELVASAHDCSDAGLAAALAECCFGCDSGANLDISQLLSTQSDLDIWGALFGESLGRILVSIKPKNSQLFEEYMKGHTCNLLGVVCPEDEIIFRNSEEVVLSASMSDLRNSWKGTLNGGIN